MAYLQTDRLLSITTPLGRDTLLVSSFDATESLSRMFRFTADLLSENDNIDPAKIIGEKVAVTLELPDGEERYFHGIVSRFSWVGRDEEFTSYRLEMSPWLWFLTRQADCRVFQSQTIPDVIKKVFDDAGYHDYDFDLLEGEFDKWEYCVQYRETHFNFVSRLLEQYGISYFFRHEKGRHVLVLANTPSAFEPCEHQATAEFLPVNQSHDATDFVEHWTREDVLHTGRYALNDYDFKDPKTKLLVSADAVKSVGPSDDFEFYDFPGEYSEKSGVGEPLAKARMEEIEAGREVYSGSTSCRAFSAGVKFKLQGHRDRKAFNAEYLLTEVHHSASVGSFGSGDGPQTSYSNRVTALLGNVHVRPQRITPKPIVQGLQTAVVVGPKGDEIHTDDYGRIRVQFFWDRYGKRDEKSSCYVRVSHPLAGRRWGFSAIPRIGQEVVVAFMEGDPDEPLVIGTVYNADQMPPYLGKGLDGKHAHDPNLSGFKSNSTKGGDGFNEWRFDDTKGKEQVFVHAERNLDTRVKNDEMEFVGKDRHLDIKGSQQEQVAGDKHLYVKTNHVEKIDGAMILEIVKDHDSTIGGSKTETITSDLDHSVGGERKDDVAGDMSLSVGSNFDQKIGQKLAADAGQEIHLKAGMKVIIESGLQITLKGAGGFIDIGPTGVTIQGTMVLINSGGSAGSGSGASPKKPKKAKKEKPKEPVAADESKSGTKSS